jgi:phosphoglycerate dehydrogenase-like enzyme
LRAAVFFLTSASERLDPRARDVLSECDVYEQAADDGALGRCQVLMTWPRRARKELLTEMTSLRMIQALSAGVDGLDFASVPPGVEVFSNAGAYTDSAAEHAWGLALGVAKGVHAGRRRLPPRHLRSKTLLVVGCGAIGSEVARLARSSLGMSTIGVSRSFRHPELFEEKHSIDALGEVIGRADLIVDALPLTRLTRSVFNLGLLMKAKPTVILVNIGRGETVDEDSLKTWLRERPESRYATDVFWKREGREVFDSDVWEFENFGGTMHTASAQDREAIAHAQVVAAENVVRFLKTGSARNRVDVAEYLPERSF